MNRLSLLVAVVGIVLFLTVLPAFADESAGVPKKALEALSFFVGDWEGETYENGAKIGADRDQRKWVPGKYCVTMEGSGAENGTAVHFSGISGWEAKADQLVEHWHGANGIYVEVRYPLQNMKGDLWEGTHSAVFADGKGASGQCQLKKTQDGFVWTAQWKQDGKDFERKSVARRVTPKPSAQSVAGEKTKVPEEVAKLFPYYVGDWTVEGKVGDAPLKGKATFRMPPGKHCIVGTVSFQVKEESVEQFSLVSGWDSSTGWTTEQGAGSDGGIYNLKWRRVSATVEEGELVGTLDGKKITEKDRYERKGPDDFMVTCTERIVGDEKLPDITFIYHRVAREKAKDKAAK